MRNKKIIITLMAIIIVLLSITIISLILNVLGINVLYMPKHTITSNINNNLNENEIALEASNITALIEENETTNNIRNNVINKIISRSNINRQEGVYINLAQTSQNNYEEIKSYIDIKDVKISFNMNVAQTTGLSQEDFVKLVQNMKYDKTGILEKNAAWIWECCQKYNVNEIFVLGICGIESAWCSAPQHQKTHNYSSLMQGGKLIAYPTDEAGFEAMIKLLGQKYLSPKGSLYHGSTITGVGTRYCNTTTWPKKVYTCMQQVFK